jgi:acyl carrier protein
MSSYSYIEEVLAKKFEVDPGLINPGATLTDLGLDSLSIAELVFEIGDKYDIDIPDNRANFATLGEAVAVVDELIQAKAA